MTTVGLRTDLWLKLSVPYSKEDRDFEGCPGVVSLKPQNNMSSSKEYMELAWPRGCTETAIVALVGLVGPQSILRICSLLWAGYAVQMPSCPQLSQPREGLNSVLEGEFSASEAKNTDLPTALANRPRVFLGA